MLLRVLASTRRPVGVACASSGGCVRSTRPLLRMQALFVRSTARASFVRVGLTRQLRPAPDYNIAHGSALNFIRILVTWISTYPLAKNMTNPSEMIVRIKIQALRYCSQGFTEMTCVRYGWRSTCVNTWFWLSDFAHSVTSGGFGRWINVIIFFCLMMIFPCFDVASY